jgi:hypothetical protein
LLDGLDRAQNHRPEPELFAEQGKGFKEIIDFLVVFVSLCSHHHNLIWVRSI